MPNAKVTLNGTTLIDLTSDSVTASALMSGVTAHDSSGALITGIIAAKTSADITVAGPTVTVSSGYYPSAFSIAVALGSVITSIAREVHPTLTLNSATGKINVEVDDFYDFDPIESSGYISKYDNPLTYNAWGNSSLQLSTKSSATYTPSTTAQTIASGQYLTGAQTIAGDTNLIAANIASGISIFGVTGTHTGGVDTSNDTVTESALLSGYTAHDSTGTQITGSLEFVNYYTGSSAPSSSLGIDDDLYLQTGSIAHVSNEVLVIDSTVTGNILIL